MDFWSLASLKQLLHSLLKGNISQVSSLLIGESFLSEIKVVIDKTSDELKGYKDRLT